MQNKVRYHAIDAMRGFAAMAVVLHHLVIAVRDKSGVDLGWLAVFGEYGRYGVEIFFVLSGFVIAHSTRDGEYSLTYLGRFAARRAIRLDIPYWATIAFEVLLLAVSGFVMSAYAHPVPPLGQIAANMFYVQTFLGYEHILPIFWTLCYEVQFYLAFVGALIVLRRVDGWLPSQPGRHHFAAFLLCASFVISLAVFALRLPILPGLFLDRWFQFVLGVVTYLYVRDEVSVRAVLAINLTCLAVAAAVHDAYRGGSMVACVATSGIIITALRWRSIRAIFEAGVPQWLGRLSYSIYLVHLSVGWRAVVIFKTFLWSAPTLVAAISALGVGIVASLCAAWLLHKVFEAPAMRLAHRISLPKKATAWAPVGANA